MNAVTENPAGWAQRRHLDAYLGDCRELILDEIAKIVPSDTKETGGLYDLVLEYPRREGKALRPALAIATARCLGAGIGDVVRSAAVLELYHNAFLVHDDVEDGSEARRNGATLHRMQGMPIAVNVGDSMLSLCLRALLDNVEIVGVGRALRIVDVVTRMSRETAEGQMLELGWIRDNHLDVTESDYVRMVYKKTSWYSFITPMLVGAVTAGQDRLHAGLLHRFGALLGIAFQIQDDLLNVSDNATYGKEQNGDLWEGKYTLLLIWAARHANDAERRRMVEILNKSRPAVDTPGTADWEATARRLHSEGEISDRALETLRGQEAIEFKSPQDIDFLLELMLRSGAKDYAREVAMRYARRARKTFDRLYRQWPDNPHRRFLEALVAYVLEREK